MIPELRFRPVFLPDCQCCSIRAKPSLSTQSGRLWRFVCLSVSLSFCHFVFLSLCLYVFFYFSLLVLVISYRVVNVVLSEQSNLFLCCMEDYGGLFVYLSLCLSVSLSFCLSVTLSICHFVFLSLCLSVFFYFSMLVLVFSCRSLNPILSEQTHHYLRCLENYGGLFAYLSLCLSVTLSYCHFATGSFCILVF
jgi:hypothetical protein